LDKYIPNCLKEVAIEVKNTATTTTTKLNELNEKRTTRFLRILELDLLAF